MPHLPDLSAVPSLVLRARRGDTDAWAKLQTLFLPELERRALRIARNRDDAFDWAIEALEKAWGFLPQIRDPRTFQSWLFKLARRHYLDRVRSRRPDPVSIDALEYEIEDRSNVDFYVSLTRRLASEELSRAFDRLDRQFPKEAEVVFRHCVLGEPLTEMGFNPNTARSYHKRGLGHLRKILQKNQVPEEIA